MGAWTAIRIVLVVVFVGLAIIALGRIRVGRRRAPVILWLLMVCVTLAIYDVKLRDRHTVDVVVSAEQVRAQGIPREVVESFAKAHGSRIYVGDVDLVPSDGMIGLLQALRLDAEAHGLVDPWNVQRMRDELNDPSFLNHALVYLGGDRLDQPDYVLSVFWVYGWDYAITVHEREFHDGGTAYKLADYYVVPNGKYQAQMKFLLTGPETPPLVAVRVRSGGTGLAYDEVTLIGLQPDRKLSVPWGYTTYWDSEWSWSEATISIALAAGIPAVVERACVTEAQSHYILEPYYDEEHGFQTTRIVDTVDVQVHEAFRWSSEAGRIVMGEGVIRVDTLLQDRHTYTYVLVPAHERVWILYQSLSLDEPKSFYIVAESGQGWISEEFVDARLFDPDAVCGEGLVDIAFSDWEPTGVLPIVMGETGSDS